MKSMLNYSGNQRAVQNSLAVNEVALISEGKVRKKDQFINLNSRDVAKLNSN